MNILECFQSTWNVSRQPGKFTDNLERFQATWRVSRQPRKFLDNLESLHTAWKDSRQPGLFPDNHKVSRQPGLFSDNLESFSKSFQTLTNSSYILYYKSCTRCMMYVHIYMYNARTVSLTEFNLICVKAISLLSVLQSEPLNRLICPNSG